MRTLIRCITVGTILFVGGCKSLEPKPGLPRATLAYQRTDQGCLVATGICDVQMNSETIYHTESGAYKSAGHAGEAYWLMNYASVCMFNGNYEHAEEALLRAISIIDNRDDPKAAENAKNTSLRLKVFRGEPFERSMAAFYCGLLKYMKGEYEDAAVLFRKSIGYDGRTGEDKAEYREDFQPAYYMLARTYLKMGREEEAVPAFRRASAYLPYDRGPFGKEAEQLKVLKRAAASWAKQRAAEEARSSESAAKSGLPANEADLNRPEAAARFAAHESEPTDSFHTPSKEELCDPDLQGKTNLLLFVETGLAPVRELGNKYKCEAELYHAIYPERRCEVYVDGVYAGETVRLAYFWHHAQTRGQQDEVKLQIAKAVGKSVAAEVAKRVPFAGGLVKMLIEAGWDISADPRSWFLLPGELHVFAANVPTGQHTVSLRFFDWNNQPLPRYAQTWHYIAVPDSGERVLLLSAGQDRQNEFLSSAQASDHSATNGGTQQ